MAPARLPLTHGTRHGYLSHQCRCEPCVEAYRGAARADYWATRPGRGPLRQREDAREPSTFVPRASDGRVEGVEDMVIPGQFTSAPRTSWWTVAESGEAFRAELREAQARMGCTPAKDVRMPDVSHLRDMRAGRR